MRWALPFLLTLAGCGAAPVPEPTPACAPTLTPGTTGDTGQPVELHPGDPLHIHAGPQGGFHVFATARATGLPQAGVLRFELTSDAGVLAEQRLDLETAALTPRECGWERGSTVLFLNSFDPAPLRQTRATLRVSAGGTEGHLEVVLQ